MLLASEDIKQKQNERTNERILWVCWKLSAAEQVKTDCCRTPAVVSTFDRLRCLGHCPVLWPLRTITTLKKAPKGTHAIAK